MKKTFFVLMIFMSLYSGAQNLLGLSVSEKQQEQYIHSLFSDYYLLYCTIDTVKSGYVKSAKLIFADSTFFFSVKLVSTPFSKREYEKFIFQCKYIIFDDGTKKGAKYVPVETYRIFFNHLLYEIPVLAYGGSDCTD